jgi:gamma-glutamylcyclotransferase
MSDTFLYLAYGSNMCTRRLKERAPSAVPVGTGFVEGRMLTFAKISIDGSGKCDIEQTLNPADRVHGVLFRVDSTDAENLDRAEGLGQGYCKEEVQVLTPEGTVVAVTYIATAKDPDRLPYSWYKEFVLQGAIEHGLPDDYVAGLRVAPTKDDPNTRRQKNNEVLLRKTS